MMQQTEHSSFGSMNSQTQTVLTSPQSEVTTISQLQRFHKERDKDIDQGVVISSTREDLNEEAFLRELMNRGEKIMYDVIPELQDVLKLPAVADRLTV